jgi:hypothetical protein
LTKLQGDIDEANEHWDLHQGSDYSRKGLAGIDPKTATLTAMASSKLLEAAVKERVVL